MAFRVAVARRMAAGGFWESASEWAIKASGYRRYGASANQREQTETAEGRYQMKNEKGGMENECRGRGRGGRDNGGRNARDEILG